MLVIIQAWCAKVDRLFATVVNDDSRDMLDSVASIGLVQSRSKDRARTRRTNGVVYENGLEAFSLLDNAVIPT